MVLIRVSAVFRLQRVIICAGYLHLRYKWAGESAAVETNDPILIRADVDNGVLPGRHIPRRKSWRAAGTCSIFSPDVPFRPLSNNDEWTAYL